MKTTAYREQGTLRTSKWLNLRHKPDAISRARGPHLIRSCRTLLPAFCAALLLVPVACQAVGDPVNVETNAPKTLEVAQANPATSGKTAEAASSTAAATSPSESAALVPPAPETRNHEVAISGDYFLGEGNVTMPIGFALAPQNPAFNPSVQSLDRVSDYFGGTASYGYLPKGLYLDVGVAHGYSSGKSEDVPILVGASHLPSKFSVADVTLGAYIKYTFPSLRFTPVNAYLRLGFSYVDADLQVATTSSAGGESYQQTDKAQDVLGNIGGGISYALPLESLAWRVQLQLEAEGFYGARSQDSRETYQSLGLSESAGADIDNTLFGGIARGTVRVQYTFKGTSLKAFVEGGLQAKYTIIDYPSRAGFDAASFDEILWGPYGKMGLRFSF